MLRPLYAEQLTGQIERWAEEFGGDFELHLFGKRTIALTSVEDIRRVLALRPSKYCRDVSSMLVP